LNLWATCCNISSKEYCLGKVLMLIQTPKNTLKYYNKNKTSAYKSNLWTCQYNFQHICIIAVH
jgi:hypothetical protein